MIYQHHHNSSVGSFGTANSNDIFTITATNTGAYFYKNGVEIYQSSLITTSPLKGLFGSSQIGSIIDLIAFGPVPYGPTGATGPAGQTGATGPQGIQGPTGPSIILIRESDYVYPYQYSGTAIDGTLTSDPGWTIKRIDFTTPGSPITQQATGSWDNRYSLTYI